MLWPQRPAFARISFWTLMLGRGSEGAATPVYLGFSAGRQGAGVGPQGPSPSGPLPCGPGSLAQVTWKVAPLTPPPLGAQESVSPEKKLMTATHTTKWWPCLHEGDVPQALLQPSTPPATPAAPVPHLATPALSTPVSAPHRMACRPPRGPGGGYWVTLAHPQQLSERYGTVFTVHLGCQKTVVLTGYEAVREALVGTGQELADRPPIAIFQLIQGGGGRYAAGGKGQRPALRPGHGRPRTPVRWGPQESTPSMVPREGQAGRAEGWRAVGKAQPGPAPGRAGSR